MLDMKAMRAIGGLLARQARARAVEADAQADEVISLGPLLEEWQAGTAAEPVTYAAGVVRVRYGVPYRCAPPGHTHRGEPGWAPGEAPALWIPYHATSAECALPWERPTGAHDMYKAGEFMIYTDGVTYRAKMDTAYSPEEYAQAWEAVQEAAKLPG